VIRIRSREQLLDWLTEEVKRLNRRSLVRALAEGHAELLGWFNLNPPGWIVRVTSRTGQVWNLRVTAVFKRYGLREVKQVPWDRWTGGESPLYQGDNPTRYEYLRREKVSHLDQTRRRTAAGGSGPVLL
jgi:hypothetical protein